MILRTGAPNASTAIRQRPPSLRGVAQALGEWPGKVDEESLGDTRMLVQNVDKARFCQQVGFDIFVDYNIGEPSFVLQKRHFSDRATRTKVRQSSTRILTGRPNTSLPRLRTHMQSPGSPARQRTAPVGYGTSLRPSASARTWALIPLGLLVQLRRGDGISSGVDCSEEQSPSD